MEKRSGFRRLLDDDSRILFHNAHDYHAPYPNAPRRPARFCGPRVTQGPILDAIRRRLAARAGLKVPTAMPLRGVVEIVRADRVEGWAQNPLHSEAPVCLDILSDGALVVQTVANLQRPELEAAGLASGRRCFRAHFAAPLTPTSSSLSRFAARSITRRCPGWPPISPRRPEAARAMAVDVGRECRHINRA